MNADIEAMRMDCKRVIDRCMVDADVPTLVGVMYAILTCREHLDAAIQAGDVPGTVGELFARGERQLIVLDGVRQPTLLTGEHAEAVGKLCDAVGVSVPE